MRKVGLAPRVRGDPQDAKLLRDMREYRLKADYDRKPVERRWLEFRKCEVERFVEEATA